MTAETNRKETTRYLYGNGLICEQTGNQTLYHHYNQVGSTTELTDADGRLLYTYSYGTYGELLNGNKTITRFLYNGQYGVSTDSNGLYYMRQRYYSPQLKRFLNQDIVTGDPKESQSLNRYCYVQGNPVSLTDPFGLSPLENPEKWLPFIHTILDVIGCIPGPVGAVANLINGILYFLVDHDPLMGGLSMLAAVTAGASKLAVGVGKAAKTAQIIESFGNIVSNAASFLINSKMLVDTALSMKGKYNENGQVLDSSFAGDAAQLALSALGMIMFGKGALGSGKNLKKSLEKNADNTLDMNLQFFAGSKSGKSSVLDNAINNGQPLNNHRIVPDTEASSLLANKQPPNSSSDLLNPDGSVKQRRYYGEDGKAQMDIDFNHTDDGTHEFPHIHIWDWTKKPPRQDSRR